MIQRIDNFIKYLLSSLDNSSVGASGKKLTALSITIAYCFAHRYVDSANLTSVLAVDGGLITALFATNVYEKTKMNNNENGN